MGRGGGKACLLIYESPRISPPLLVHEGTPLFLLCVVVACHSVKTAMALHARMQAECGLEPGDMKFYHGASDGKQKREDFANATLAWGGDVIAVVPTPSLCSAHACFVLFF